MKTPCIIYNPVRSKKVHITSPYTHAGVTEWQIFSSVYKYKISLIPKLTTGSRDSSVGIVLGYGLDDLGSSVRFPAGAGNFSLHHRVQKGSGAHPASYSMGTRGSFSGSKAAGT
jgi:hypothetical protein